MTGQVTELRKAAAHAHDAAMSLAKAAEELGREVAVSAAYVADLDKKRDQLRKIETEIEQRKSDLATVTQALDEKRAALALLKSQIPV